MIIPPFRDAHLHFAINGKEISREGILSIGKSLLNHGIFEVWEMGIKNALGFEAKRILKDFINIKVSGLALYKKGHYGVFLGKGISGVDEIEDAIEDISRRGVDFLKVINSGIVTPRTWNNLSRGIFSFEELKVICSIARDKALEVVCHANGMRAIEEAVRAGVSSIEHGYRINEELLHFMKEKDVSWTPTLYALFVYSQTLPEDEQKIIERILREHMDLINYAISAGVKINIGTDSGARGVEHGEAFFGELRLFKKAGLSLNQIINIACMPADEIYKGNYLLVKEDFIETGKIHGIYLKSREITTLWQRNNGTGEVWYNF